MYLYGLGVITLPIAEDHGRQKNSDHKHDATGHHEQKKMRLPESHYYTSISNHNDGDDH